MCSVPANINIIHLINIPANMRAHVDVSGASGIEAGNRGDHLHHALVVGGLETAEVGFVCGAFGGVAGVDAGGVGVPDVDHGGGDGEAGVDVDEFEIEE